MVTDACPMYVASAFAFTPAAIISDAYVCRHSCSVIGCGSAFFQGCGRACGDALRLERAGGASAEDQAADDPGRAELLRGQDRPERRRDRDRARPALVFGRTGGDPTPA